MWAGPSQHNLLCPQVIFHSPNPLGSTNLNWQACQVSLWLGLAVPVLVAVPPHRSPAGVVQPTLPLRGCWLSRRGNGIGLAGRQPRWPVASGVSGSSPPLTLPRTSDTWRPCPFSRQWTWPGAGRRGSRSPLPQRERVGGNRRAVSS